MASTGTQIEVTFQMARHGTEWEMARDFGPLREGDTVMVVGDAAPGTPLAVSNIARSHDVVYIGGSGALRKIRREAMRFDPWSGNA